MPHVSYIDEDEMRDLVREVADKLYTFLVKIDNPHSQAVCDHWWQDVWKWDKPKLHASTYLRCAVGIREHAGRPGTGAEGAGFQGTESALGCWTQMVIAVSGPMVEPDKHA